MILVLFCIENLPCGYLITTGGKKNVKLWTEKK